MKKTIAVFTLCLMLISWLPALASTGGDFTYVANDEGGVTITGYTGKTANLTIPAQLGGKDVTRIATQAFNNNKYIQNVTISEGIKTIEFWAFELCEKLVSISLPASVEDVGENFCLWCYNLRTINVAPGNARYAQIDGVLFEKPTKTLLSYPPAKKGSKYEIPRGIKYIERDAFSSNKSLTTIVIADTVIGIGSDAFQNAVRLSTVIIPASVERIQYNVFRGCDNLVNIEVAVDNNHFKSVDNVLYSKNGNALIAYPAGKKESVYSVLDGTRTIEDNAFEGCAKLKTITLPHGITEICSAAFFNCHYLENISLPDTLISIKDIAFSACWNLRNIKLPDGLTDIGWSAFWGCDHLYNITIPRSVTSIGAMTFDECDLVTVSVGAGSYAEEYCKTNQVKYKVDPAL